MRNTDKKSSFTAAKDAFNQLGVKKPPLRKGYGGYLGKNRQREEEKEKRVVGSAKERLSI